jgi:hypothetical protein
VNRLIDAFIHPLAKRHPGLLILDGIVHGLIEKNPSETAAKFIQYNLPKLLSEYSRSRKTREKG